MTSATARTKGSEFDTRRHSVRTTAVSTHLIESVDPLLAVHMLNVASRKICRSVGQSGMAVMSHDPAFRFRQQATQNTPFVRMK
ncbi:MAG: hypothetical protein U5M50_02065 [Sphingobium sp.]|nr:hypothetical protein [Sphingobium sp.]